MARKVPYGMRRVVEATGDDAEARAEAQQFGSRVGTPWVVWLWVPPLGGVVRYPVLRGYQYVCMVLAWIVLGIGQIWAVIVMDLALGAADPEGGGFPFPHLLSVSISVWSVFIFLSLRAAVEVIQVYLDIEDNTRASATALSKLRSKSASQGKSTAPREQSVGDEGQPS